MLDQLVESKEGTDGGGRRNGLLLVTTILMVGAMSGAMYYSLFNKDYGLGSGDFELSELVAPVPMAEEEPPPPEPEEKPQQEQKAAPNADVRKVIMDDVSMSTKPPDKVSNEKNTVPPRNPNNRTVLGDKDLNADNAASVDYKGPVSDNNQGSPGPGGDPNNGNPTGGTKPPPPPPVKPPDPPKPPVPKKISGGVLNGKASNLVTPPYPAAARAVRASGAVNVQVTINESGSVVSATAVSGHPLLRQAAVNAARASKFSPTLLSGQPVSVTGIIIYNFNP